MEVPLEVQKEDELGDVYREHGAILARVLVVDGHKGVVVQTCNGLGAAKDLRSDDEPVGVLEDAGGLCKCASVQVCKCVCVCMCKSE